MNPYLEGHFAPVCEEVTAYDPPVTSRIPAELNGRYLRNGPNPLGIEDPAAHHWMLGEGMVHGLAYAHNPDRGAADLVILSAQDFTGKPLARVHLPARVPLGFHGSWIADA